ncbi:MAG: hypothetical protein JO327_05390 [Nitrososphaeraceae archaeon]|nr:hypothetical protein [Nitrososphaeraceae archaeon]
MTSPKLRLEIPRIEISSITDERITLKLTQNKINEKHQHHQLRKAHNN